MNRAVGMPEPTPGGNRATILAQPPRTRSPFPPQVPASARRHLTPKVMDVNKFGALLEGLRFAALSARPDLIGRPQRFKSKRD
jgi:hypothetical protein